MLEYIKQLLEENRASIKNKIIERILNSKDSRAILGAIKNRVNQRVANQIKPFHIARGIEKTKPINVLEEKSKRKKQKVEPPVLKKIKNKKEKQKVIGAKTAETGFKLENIIIDKINEGCFSLKELESLFNLEKDLLAKNSFKLKADNINKRSQKVDFSIFLANQKENNIINVSQKSIQSKTSAETHLHGTSSQNLIKTLNEKGCFKGVEEHERADIEIVFTLFVNCFYFEKDKMDRFQDLLFSNREEFNFWGKEKSFNKCKNKETGTGMKMEMFQALFPEKYKLFEDFIIKNNLIINNLFLFGDYYIEYLFVVDNVNNILEIYSFKDVLEFCYGEKPFDLISITNQKDLNERVDSKNLIVRSKSVKLNDVVSFSAKGSGNSKDKIEKIKKKSLIQAKINLKRIRENIKPVLVKKDLLPKEIINKI